MTPRKLNKKPVLVVDPEELAREREHLHLVGAQLVGEEDAMLEPAPAPVERQASPIGLAAVGSEEWESREESEDEQDLPPLDEDFTDTDALLGMSEWEEAAEDEADEPVKRVGLDLDALREASGFETEAEPEEEAACEEDPDFSAFETDLPTELPERRIGLDLDALGMAEGFGPAEEPEEAPVEEDARDFSTFEEEMPTELPEKRIGLDLDALRMAGGYDDEEEEDELPVNMPDFSAFRSPAAPEEPHDHEAEDAGEDTSEWPAFEDEPVDFAETSAAPESTFEAEPEPVPEPEPDPVGEVEPAPLPELEAEPEPAAYLEPETEAEPEFTAEPETLPEVESEPQGDSRPEPVDEPEPEPEPEELAEPRVATEPTLLRVSTWWPEDEAPNGPVPAMEQEPPFADEPYDQAGDIPQDAFETAEFPQPEEAGQAQALPEQEARPPRPAHCEVRARLLRSEAQGVRKPKGLRGWLHRFRLWLNGY